MANQTTLQTVLLAIGQTYTTQPGARQIDILNQGTAGDVTFTGTKQDATNDALPVPPGYSYSTGFNTNGYGELIITNNSDAACPISLFW